MSVEYVFYNKPLSRKALLEQTDFVIENHNDSDWIIDKGVSNIRIKDGDGDEIYQLENHGWKNVNNIIDTIVSKFGITYYTDNELSNFYQLCHHRREGIEFPYPDMLDADGDFDFEAACVRDMMYFGDYDVLDVSNGVVIIPTR